MKVKNNLINVIIILIVSLFISCTNDEEIEDLSVASLRVNVIKSKSSKLKITNGSGSYTVESKFGLPGQVIAEVKKNEIVINGIKEGETTIVLTDIKSQQTKEISINVLLNLQLSEQKIVTEVGNELLVDIITGNGDYEITNDYKDKVDVLIDEKQIIINGKKEGSVTVLIKDNLSNDTVELSITINENGKFEQRILVKAGTFIMGGPIDNPKNGKQHQVTLTKDFYIGKYEVTNAQYARFLNEKGNQKEGEMDTTWINISHKKCGIEQVDNVFKSKEGQDDLAVTLVNWFGAFAYAKWAGGRLPTEAEWEYAAIGGHNATVTSYSGSNNVNEVANIFDNDKGYGELLSVGSKKPNELGIYDMSGNVSEWCNDWTNRSTGDAQTDPQGGPSGTSNTDKVTRGGNFRSDDWGVHVAYCDNGRIHASFIDYGFRVAFSHE